MVELGRKIAMFRCHFAPLIGPTPKQAYVPKDMDAHAELMDHGVYIRLKTGIEHFVPFSNIESIRFEPEEAKITNIEEKRGPGRPKSGAI